MKDFKDDSLYLYIQAVCARKTSDIVILDLKGKSSVTDYFIICSVQSTRQASGVSQFIISYLKDYGIKPLSAETPSDGKWQLLDYGDVIINIFYEPIREFYDLEGLWADAKIIII